MAAASVVPRFVRSIRYTPFTTQKKFHLSMARFKGFSGPIGTGKSLTLVHEAVKLAYLNNGCTGLIGAPSYPMLRDTTLIAFMQVLADNDIPHEWHKSEYRLELFEPASNIIFRSLDNYERLRGTNLAWFGIDELSFCKEQAWLRLQGRLREPRAKHRCGYGVWTPNGYNWTYHTFVDEERTNDYVVFCASPFENKALLKAAPDFYERLKTAYDEKFYAQEVLGQYLDIFRGRVYYAFDKEKHVVDAEYDPREPLVWSLDFNIDPMCSIVAQDIGGKVRILDEICLQDSNTLEACKAFYNRTAAWREKWSVVNGGRAFPVKLYGDPAGSHRQSAAASRSDYDVIRLFFREHRDLELSYNVASSHPLVKDRVAAVNGAFQSAAGKSILAVHSRCKRLIKDLREVSWKPGTGELDKQKDAQLTHVSDAMGYFVYREHRVSGFERVIVR